MTIEKFVESKIGALFNELTRMINGEKLIKAKIMRLYKWSVISNSDFEGI